MINDSLILGGVVFWGLMLFASIILVGCIESERRWGGGLTVILALLTVLALFSPAWQWVRDNPVTLAIFVLGYIVIGIIWTVPRWLIFLRWIRAELRKLKKAFFEEHELSYVPGAYVPEEFYDAWSRCLQHTWLFPYGVAFQDGKLVPPPFQANRDMIITWAVLWPWSMFWTLFREVFVRVIEAWVDWWGRLYARLSAWFFRDF